MRVVFDEAFHDSSYSEDKYDNAAGPGRLVGVMQALRGDGGYGVAVLSPAARESWEKKGFEELPDGNWEWRRLAL